MREVIIKESISSLQEHGLKFSLDMLVEKLKISKKTIYKYFENKQQLATEIYQYFYQDLHENLQLIVSKGLTFEHAFQEIFLLYHQSANMNKNELFNKFNLNDVIRSHAADAHAKLWNDILNYLQSKTLASDMRIFKIIVDGAMDKATYADIHDIIKMLWRIVC